MCVYSLSYVACKALASYYIVICGHIFPHYIINDTVIKMLSIKFVFFSTNLDKIFLTLRRIQRDTVTDVHKSSCKVPVILVSF